MLRNGTQDLVLPLAIMGNEQHIRHLVLEIKLDSRSPMCQAQLNKACRGIGHLSSKMPKLEVYVVSLFLERKEHENPVKSFDPEKLALRNQIGWKVTDTEDLKTTLVKFLNVLYAKGPGRQKFVRFIDRRKNMFAHAGPLVKIPQFVAPRTQDGSSEVDASEGPTDQFVAEQVLKQAYRYHRDIAPRPVKRAEVDEADFFHGKVGNTAAVIKGGELVWNWEQQDSPEC